MANKGSPAKQRYDKAYNARPAQKKKRAMRNAANRKTDCPPGQDVHHVKPIRKGGTNKPKNLQCTSKTSNRGWRKGQKGYGS